MNRISHFVVAAAAFAGATMLILSDRLREEATAAPAFWTLHGAAPQAGDSDAVTQLRVARRTAPQHIEVAQR